MAYRGRGPPGPSSSDGYGMYGGYRGPGDFPGPPPSFPPYGHGYGPGPGDIYARQDIPPPGRPGLPPPPLGPSYGSSYDRPAISDRLGPPVDLPPYSGYRPGGDSARGLYSNPDDKKYTSASSEMVSRDYGHGNIDDSQDYKPSSKSDGRGGSGSQQASINLDALLQDERLKNVLFAGISKATAKLEQSLNPLGDNTPENVAFLSDSMKNMPSQLFPAASSSTEPSSRPKSILKKKSGSGGGGGVDENDSSHDPLSKLSALEKTLQLLRGKPTTSDAPGSEKGSQDRSRQSVAAKGALGQLASYDDGGGEDEESYLYDKSDRHEKLSQPAGKHAGTPFWSVDAIPPASETLKREKDTFDIQDKLYEQWRQSINRDSQEPSRNDQSIPQVDPFFQKKIPAQMAAIASQAMQEAEKDNEELDSTVQNILQSIGFNFDLSKRMQELAKQKKKQQDELQTGIVDQSASFLDQGGNLVEEVRASLFKNEQEKTSIENLIKEARASSQKNRSSYERSSSPSKWSDRGSRERGHAQDKPSHHRDRSPGAGSSDRYRSSVRSSPERYDARDRRSQERSRHRGSWEEISPQREDEWDRPGSRRREDGRLSYERGGERRQRSLSQERRAATPPQSRYLDDPGWTSHKKLSDRHNGSRISERLRDEPKDEYFYPEDNDYTESPPAMPLLTSFSSRRKEEDLSSGLFPSKKLYTQARPPVENLRVMSRAVDDDDDVESFTQSRRIILPAKSERRVVSKSPTYRGSRSPDMKYSQKRSASPLISRVSKERRLDSERVEYYERDRDGYYGQDYHHQDRPQSPGFDRSMNEQFHDRRGSSDGYRTASHRSEQYYMSSPPGGSSDRVRDMSPRQHMLEDPEQTYDEYHSAIGRMEEVRRYSPEKAKSPARDDYYEKESRNYDKESRKKTPERQSSRSGARHRSRSRDRRRSRSPHHRRSRSRSDDRRRRSPERRRSPGRERRRSPARRRSADRRKSPGRKQTSGKYKDSKSSSGTKPGQSRFKLDRRDKPQELPKIDVSKLAPAVRKAYLQKLLEEKNTNVDDAKVNLLAAIEQLASISPEERKNLLVKMTVVSAEERQKMMQNLSMRQIKVSALNLELEKLKKEQNELMRKCQRSGLGTNDPMLVQNAKAQESLEKEIKRLSAADFHVSLEEPAPPPKSSPPPSHARDESSKPTATGPKGKPTSAAPQKPSSSEAVRKNDKGSWKSVTVKADEGLPDIGEPVKKEETSEKDKAKNQEGNRKASRDNSTSQTSGGKKVYYEYYDSGNHWCKYCSVSCNALEQLFQHSHGKKHLNCIEHEKRPWKDSKKEQKTPAKKFGVAQSRRIKGAELMFPVVGFYCTLCKVFCGDFIESTDHLKTDGHYDKYTEFVKLNPMYEKKLLLEKAAGLTAKKHTETVTQPPPPPTPPPPPKSSEKKAGTKQTHSNKAQTPSDKDQAPKTKSVKKHLRVTGKTSNAESDDESKEKDNIEVVDMELDDEEEESVSVVKSKVPKLTGKPSGVLPPWTSLPSSGKSSMVDMKETKEDDNQPLDTFLNIKVDKKEDKKTELPVVVGPELDLSVIPIPDLLDIPIPEGPSLFGKSEACESSQVSTVKSLQEVQAEEKRQMDEEKRMMGIDVDAEEEKPLSAIPVPPPSVADVPLPKDPIPDEKDSTKKSKPKSLDTLFAKLNKNVSCRPKPKPTVQSETVPEMEQKIQEEIRARLEREKIKLLRQKQKKEMKEKKAEDGWVKKKRIESDTSSSEESDDSDESQNTIDKEGTESQAGLANEATAHSGEGVESGAPSDTVSSHVQVGDEQVTQTEEKQKTQFEEEQVTQIEEKQKTQTEEEQVTQTGEKQKTQMEEGQITQTEEEQKSQTGEEQVAQTGDDQKNAPQDKENAKADETGKNETHDTEMKVASQEENVIEGKESQNSSETMSPVKETLHTAVENEASYEKADATKSFKEKTPSKSEVKTKKGIPKGKVTAKMTDDYSDISAFLVSSEDSAINLADRSIVAKKAGAKKTPKKAATAVSRSGKRVTRGSKQKEEATEEGDDIAKLMLDGGMIVLSEVTDEEEDQDMSEDQLVEVQESQDHEDDIQDKSLMQKPESGNAENDESAKNVSQNRDNEESIFITVEPSCSDAKEEPQDLDEANESKDSECIAHAVEVEQPQELDEIAEVSSSSRGRGRGKKAGGRGRGRGRRAAAVAQAKIEAQIGAAVFDVDDNLVPTSDGDVTRQQDSASAESFPLSSPSEEHQHADMNAPSEEEPSPTRQTRSRRGGTTRRGRGRGRQTRSRTRKEEEDLHVDSDEVMDIEMVSADEKSLKTGTGHSHDEEGFSMDIENLECQARPEGEQVKSVQQEMIDNANFKDSIYEQGSQSETMLQLPNPDSTTKHTGAQISLDVGAGDLVQPTVVANIEPGKEDLLSLQASAEMDSPVQSLPVGSSEGEADRSMFSLMSDGEKSIEGSLTHSAISKPQNADDSDSEATITEETEDPALLPLPDFADSIDSIADTARPPTDDFESVDETDSGLQELPQKIGSDVHGDKSSEAQPAASEALPELQDNSEYGCVASSTSTTLDVDKKTSVDAEDTVTNVASQDTSINVDQKDSSADVAIEEAQAPGTPPQPSHGHSSGQGRDPPMSGVVSEVEETMDSMMMSVNEQSGEELESEAPPTAGLSLGLEEDEDSMEFTMVGMEDKMDAEDE